MIGTDMKNMLLIGSPLASLFKTRMMKLGEIHSFKDQKGEIHFPEDVYFGDLDGATIEKIFRDENDFIFKLIKSCMNPPSLISKEEILKKYSAESLGNRLIRIIQEKDTNKFLLIESFGITRDYSQL